MKHHKHASFFDDSQLGKKGIKAREERIKKIVTYTPEIVVKVTGFTKDFHHVKTHLNYISRHGSLPLEDEQGHVYHGKDDIQDVFSFWQSHHYVARNYQDKTRCTAHLVLSMPYGTDETILQDAVRSFARKQFPHYRYLMALHQDTDNPHIHLTIQSCGFNKTRLQIKRGDPQKWREIFAEELDKRGIDAEATPRAIRGIVLKPITQTLKQMKRRAVTLKTAKSMVDTIRTIWTQDQQTIQPRPWEAKIKANHAKIRNRWLQIAQEYYPSNKVLSDIITSFVDKMPPPLTKREIINQNIFASVRNITKAKELLHDHPELKEDIFTILNAQHHAQTQYNTQQQKEDFIHKIITDIAHKRLNGKSLQPSITENNPTSQNNNNQDKHQQNHKEIDYEI